MKRGLRRLRHNNTTPLFQSFVSCPYTLRSHYSVSENLKTTSESTSSSVHTPNSQIQLNFQNETDYTKIAKQLLQNESNLESDKLLSLLQSPAADTLQTHIKRVFLKYRRNGTLIPAPVTTALLEYFYKHNMITEALNVNSYAGMKKIEKDPKGWGILCRVQASIKRKDLLSKTIGRFTTDARDAQREQILKDPIFLQHATLATGDCNDPTSLAKLLEARTILQIRKWSKKKNISFCFL